MAVFIFHMRFQFPLWSEDATDNLAQIIKNGYLGVDMFFVISGFILAWVGVLSRNVGTISPLEFLVKRFFRVAPAYWVSIAVIAYVLARQAQTDQLLMMLLFYPLGNEIPPYYSEILNEVGWTLNYEMAFYFIFCISLAFGRHTLIVITFIILILVLLVPLAFGHMPTLNPAQNIVPFQITYFRMVTNPMMLEFLLGIACAWVFFKAKDRASPAMAVLLIFLGATSLLLCFWTSDEAFSVLGAGLPTAILLVGMLLAEYLGILRVPKFSVWLGDVSFALYLTHWTIQRVVVKYLPEPNGVAATYGKAIVITAIALLISHFWKKYIEDPTGKWAHIVLKQILAVQMLIKNVVMMIVKPSKKGDTAKKY